MPQELEEETNLSEIFRAEVNLLTHPFFALTTKDVLKRQKTEYQAVVQRDDEKLEINWKVSAHQEYGYPGPFGKKVHKAIEQVIEEQQFPVENPIRFSIYELCKRIGITLGGRQYEQIKESLKRIQATIIESKGTFYQKSKKRWINKTFSLYDGIIFKGEELNNGEIAETNYLYLNDMYLDSINARYVKPLDYEYYMNLRTNIAQRLYELLGVKFYGISNGSHSYIRYNYSTLCKLLPLIPQKYLSKARKILDPAHEELEETRFLSKVHWSEVEGEQDWYLYYYPGKRAKEEIEKSKVPENSTKAKVNFLGPPSSSNKSTEEIENLVNKMVRVLGKREENKGFYYKIARHCPENVINMALSDTEAEERSGEIEKSKPAFFGYWIQELCEERGINLGLNLLENGKGIDEKEVERNESEEGEVSERHGSSNSGEKEIKQGQASQEARNEKGKTETGHEVNGTEEAEKTTKRRAQLMEYYRSLSPEKQDEIDDRAMENLNDFTKGKARRLKKEGKDPLKESVAVKADFKANRFEILRKEMTPDD